MTTYEEETTKQMLMRVLRTDMGEETVLYVPSGEGSSTLHRIRVELSRVKSALKRKGQQIRKFKMHADITTVQIGHEFKDRIRITCRDHHATIRHSLNALETLLQQEK